MNVNEMTFGIEIETHLPLESSIAVGPHGRGYEIANIPALAGWKADGDPSIHARGRKACEFVSPVFRGPEGLRLLLAGIDAIRALGANVNRSCGLHIHVGFDKNNAEDSAKLVTLVANFEKAIFAIAPAGAFAVFGAGGCMQRYATPDRALQASRQNRYHLSNFGSEKPTVEFRAFSASLNNDKIVGYLRLCLGLVERAIKAQRITNWTAKAVVETSPIHRDGEGQTALTRLFYQLGWTKGRQAHVHGDLTAADVPGIDRSKRALMKMARKYDSQT